MIRFIDKEGNVFDGRSPYVHWLDGGQSIGLWYTLKLLVISDDTTGSLEYSGLNDNEIFKFVNKNTVSEDPDINNSLIGEGDDDGTLITIDNVSYKVYQVLIECHSDTIGQYTQNITLSCGNESIDVTVGADFYMEDESLIINLGNKGLDIPIQIQKAFYEIDYKEAKIDNILINRKFKELLSNFIDVVDCKGSYKSLFNSLDWFDWGPDTKLYEIWKGENGELFEKILESTLSDIYSDLLTTHSKTTHLSIVTALQKISGNNLDEEKNPVIEDIVRKWTNEELAIKVSILGAFFERYFMPIHLDLKRASVEALVFTTSVKDKSGSIYDTYNYFDDIGVIDIDMDHTFVLGNLTEPVGASFKTVFGSRVPAYNEDRDYAIPIGVEPLNSLQLSQDYNDYSEGTDEVMTVFSQLSGAVGVLIPVTVRVKMPYTDDGINMETIDIYKYNDSGELVWVDSCTERKWYPANQETGIVTFSFNLLSTKEEKVSFALTLHSTSGHTWTGAAGYETIDISGSKIEVCRVVNKSSLGDSFMSNLSDPNSLNPWVSQYGTSDIQEVSQYIPSSSNVNNVYNEILLVENKVEGGAYISLEKDGYWTISRVESQNPTGYKYSILINKNFGSKNNSLDLEGGTLKRHEMIFIPQLHNYISIEGDYITDYVVNPSTDILCIKPQFKKTINIDTNSIKWIFKNKTTLETIEYTQPISTPIIANNKDIKLLTPGYWTVTMTFSLVGDSKVHKITKNSAFKVVK